MPPSSNNEPIPIPPVADSHIETLTNLIVFSLRYFGCDTWCIHAVLRTYGYGQSVDSVAQYITDEKLVDSRGGHDCPDSGRRVYKRVTHVKDRGCVDTNVFIDYRDELPVRIWASCGDLPKMKPEPEEWLARDADGRMVRTKAVNGLLICELAHMWLFT